MTELYGVIDLDCCTYNVYERLSTLVGAASVLAPSACLVGYFHKCPTWKSYTLSFGTCRIWEVFVDSGCNLPYTYFPERYNFTKYTNLLFLISTTCSIAFFQKCSTWKMYVTIFWTFFILGLFIDSVCNDRCAQNSKISKGIYTCIWALGTSWINEMNWSLPRR